MNWKIFLRPASFRGIKFQVRSSDRSGGRNTAVHEYVGSSQAFPEDTGGRTPEFTITGFVIGDDYMAQRDAIISALETEGPGILVHPYYGRVEVSQNGPYSVYEEASQGRMATITMSFIRYRAPISPAATANTMATSVSSAASAVAASKSAFSKAFSVASYAVTEATGMIRSAANTINGIKRQAKSIAMYQRKYNQFLNNINTIINTPVAIADALVEIISYPYGSVSYDSVAIQADLDEIFAMFSFEPAPGLSEFMENSAAALENLIQQVAVALAVRISADIAYASSEEALLSQQKITDKIDELLISTSDDDFYSCLLDLRVLLVSDIEMRSASFPRMQRITLNQTVPALVLSYSLYGNIDHEQEIVDRNRVKNPGFLPSGIPLEVLAYEK